MDLVKPQQPMIASVSLLANTNEGGEDVKLEAVIGANIGRLREEAAMSQAELGKQLAPYLGKEWTRQMVSAAENGRRAFIAAELIAFAKLLQADLPELFDVHQLAEPPDQFEVGEATMTGVDLTSAAGCDMERHMRSSDLRAVRQLIPMLDRANTLNDLLHTGLSELFLDPAEREAHQRARLVADIDSVRTRLAATQRGREASRDLEDVLRGLEDVLRGLEGALDQE